MGAIDITISGVLFDKTGRTSQPVVLVGEATITGLTVGGGPILPPPVSPGQPPGIWGPNDPRPTPPIYFPPGGGQPPGGGGGQPPGIWGGGNVPMPNPPIANVPGAPGYEPPQEPIEPPVEWKAIWAGPEHGWVVVGVPNVPHPTPS